MKINLIDIFFVSKYVEIIDKDYKVSNEDRAVEEVKKSIKQQVDVLV